MGDIADAIINGDFDEQTGEWLGEGDGFPRTRVKGHYNTIGTHGNRTPWHYSVAELKIKAVRKELAILIKETEKNNPEEKDIVNKCRGIINKKYGEGWRERGLISNGDNQWTEENKPDWWNEKLQRIMQPGMDLGGIHLKNRIADVHYKGKIHNDCVILDYSGKRGQKRYTVNINGTEVKIKFKQLDNIKKQ